MLELPPEALIHSFGSLLRTTHHGLNIDLEAAVEKLVYLPIIIVIIPEDKEKHNVSKQKTTQMLSEQNNTCYK